MPPGIDLVFLMGSSLQLFLQDGGVMWVTFFYEQNNLADQLPVHHITIFTSKDILVDHTSNGKHG